MIKKIFGYVFIVFVVLLILTVIAILPKTLAPVLIRPFGGFEFGLILGGLLVHILTIALAIWLYKLGKKWIAGQ